MPLDFELINRATEHASKNLESHEPQDLILLNDLLPVELIDKLVNFLNTTDVAWKNETDQSGKYAMEHRSSVTWEFDTVIEEVHIVFENLTDTINRLFNRSNKFLGISIWRDTANYTINRHSDNPIIDIAMQLYLTNGPANLGTWFNYNGNDIQATYQKNSGYLADNSTGIEHWLNAKVHGDHVRYSIYARWMKNNNND